MNRIAPPRRPPELRDGPPAMDSGAAHDDAVRAQAWQLDEIFKALARRVLVDDDPAGELPLRQLRVCLALFERPHSMTQLSRELGVSQSAITQIADRLEAAKMVARGPAGGDRRVISLQLTPRARKMLRLREEGRMGRVMKILARMSAGDRDAVLASLEMLREASADEL